MTKLASSVLVVVTALVATSCNAIGPTVIGSGNAKTEQPTVDSFTRVRVDEAIKATVIVGPAITVSVTTDDNVLANVSTTVRAGKLSVGMSGSVQPRIPVTVSITVPNLDQLAAGSAASVTAAGINSTGFSALAESAASLVVHGSADSVDVTANSAGSADLGDVPAQTANVKVGSAARATVNAQNSVTGSVDSGGVVRIEGNPPSVNVSTATGGAIVRN